MTLYLQANTTCSNNILVVTLPTPPGTGVIIFTKSSTF